MVRSLCLAVLALVSLCAAQNLSQCFDQLKSAAQCMQKNTPAPPNNTNAKGAGEFEQCFTKNGCTPPQKGPGGRAGPPPANNNQYKQCFESMKQQTGDEFKQCLQGKGVTLSEDNHGPEEGHPPGGPFGGPNGGPPCPASEELAQQCNNDQAKADQVKSCIKQLYESHKPTKEEAQAKYDAMCKAESECKSKITDECIAQLKKTGQAMCQCFHELKPKIEEAFKNEQSCANVKLPQPPTEADCSKPPTSPCEEGFDAFYQKVSNATQAE